MSQAGLMPPRRFASVLAVALWGLALAGSLPTAARGASSSGAFECVIEPNMVVKLGTAVPGLISEVLVDRGAVVKQGEVVARLESGVETAALALAKARAANNAAVQAARAKLEFQKRKEERALLLRRSQNIAVATADEAETAARVAEGELREAEVNFQLAQLEMVRAQEVVKQRTIRSPINGVVVERSLGPGEYAFDQAHLMTISQIDPLRVETFLPLGEFGKIHPGMLAQVYPEKPVGGAYTAKVTVVDEVFDAASGTIGVRLELPNPEHKLPAGLKCQVRFPPPA